MTDKELIFWYLDKTYMLCVFNDEFKLNAVDERYQTNNFRVKEESVDIKTGLDKIIKIFDDFKTDDDSTVSKVYDEWVSIEKEKLLNDLHECLENIKTFKDSNDLFEKVLYRMHSAKYGANFIEREINEYYFKKINKPKVDDYIAEKGFILKSDKLINDYVFNLFLTENRYQIDLIIEYINKWYEENVYKDMIDDFLSQLIVMMGLTNWSVKWIGHCEINSINTIEKLFKDESDYIIRLVKERYQKWKEDAILIKSEKMINENFVS